MPQVGIEALGSRKSGNHGDSESIWTPKNIQQIITGIKDLLGEYQKLRGITTGSAGNPIQPQPSAMLGEQPKIPPNVVTTPMIKDFVLRFCDTMIQQGNGEKRIGEVLDELPYTISQIRGFFQ